MEGSIDSSLQYLIRSRRPSGVVVFWKWRYHHKRGGLIADGRWRYAYTRCVSGAPDEQLLPYSIAASSVNPILFNLASQYGNAVRHSQHVASCKVVLPRRFAALTHLWRVSCPNEKARYLPIPSCQVNWQRRSRLSVASAAPTVCTTSPPNAALRLDDANHLWPSALLADSA